MKKLGLAVCLGLITGCSSIDINEYKNETPVLKLENYLNGALDAYGIFQDRSGKVVKRFHVAMKCTWRDGVGTLEEDFSYSDGTKSRRVWTVKKNEQGQYIGTASDVVGEAVGKTAGNAFHWQYTLDLPVGDKTYHVYFDDWMYLMDDKVMLNKSKMSKFGVELGEVTLTFFKRGS